MTYFVWTDELAVGIEPIDALQRELTERANRLFDACANGMPLQERFGELLLKLDTACSFAEEAEDELQRRFGTSAELTRPAYHREFERRIGRLLERHQQDGDVALETLQLLADWLAYHQTFGLGAWRALIHPQGQTGRQAAAPAAACAGH